MLFALALTGCGTSDEPAAGTTAEAIDSQYLGSVAADDPQAVKAARDILDRGGTAADAAVAAAEVLTVTLPARAGFGGGGVCLVRPSEGEVEELDFPIQAAAHAAVPVPGMVRGLAALQARYGKLPWAATIARAEEIANTGIIVNSMLLSDLAAAGLSAEVNGRPLSVGDTLPQHGASEVLMRIRTGGPRDFYNGKLAGALINAGMDGQALASYAARWSVPAGVTAGDYALRFSNTDAGQAGMSAWQAAAGAPAGTAETFRAARAAIGAAEDKIVGATSVTVADASGLGVSCSFTMGKLWGSGHLLGRLAIYGGAPLDSSTARAVAPLVVSSSKGLVGLYAGGGGTAAAADVSSVAVATLLGNRPLGDALNEKRGQEASGGPAAPERVNAVLCRDALPEAPESCVAQSDPRAGGFGLNVDRLTPGR